jgi:tryptophan 2,3-dioxygenase
MPLERREIHAKGSRDVKAESGAVPARAEPGMRTDLGGQLTYGRYLQLDQLLACQQGVSDSHDELLFIVIHQAMELWLKVMVHELRAARARIAEDDLPPAFKMLARVSRVQAQMIQSWDVLSTLTPADYLVFRHKLGPASGFQSHQYRLVEFLLGNKHRSVLAVHSHTPDIRRLLEEELEAPSLYDEALRLLSRRGLAVPPEVLERDWSQPYEAREGVRSAWAVVYREAATHWDLYELAEELVDLEDWSRQWRFRHVTTVERIIGHKRGTGGSSGVTYLKRALDIWLFPELWQVRTDL